MTTDSNEDHGGAIVKAPTLALQKNSSSLVRRAIQDLARFSPPGEYIYIDVSSGPDAVMEDGSACVASPEVMRSWSHGEVKYPETFNSDSLKPEIGGIFCEEIFGPTSDWECNCGKDKRELSFKCMPNRIGLRCCLGVSMSKVRCETMGHIDLAAPVSHIWFFSRIGLMLDMTARALEKVIYYEDWLVTDKGNTPLQDGQALEEIEYKQARDDYGDAFKADMGAPAIRTMLERINLPAMKANVEIQMGNTKSKAIWNKLSEKLRLVEGFIKSNSRPEWMMLEVLPVIPPDLRPPVSLEFEDGGRATSDLNDLYRRVMNRNSRLRNLLKLRTPEVIIRNEKRMLQEAVDSLLDNGRHGRAVTGAGWRPLKSLSDLLKGKQGHFRQSILLGLGIRTARVDVSSRPDGAWKVVQLPGVPTDLLKNDVWKTDRILFRKIPAGSFIMGSPSSEKGRRDNEIQHKVTLTRDFYIGVFEVTQGQYENVMGATPSMFENAGKDAPVERVSWEDCQGFCKKLGFGFRLPTEAEWEYTCRAGTTTRFNTGEAESGLVVAGWYCENSEVSYQGGYDLSKEDWVKNKTNKNAGTHPVGQKRPNAWGLYDMSGNVWEWCSDWHGGYSKETEKDPQGAESGDKRILRGGGWASVAGCRSALRNYKVPLRRGSDLGFRLAFSAGQK